MQVLNLLQSILLFAVPAVMAITVHEAAHGYTARHFGDRTAEVLGRLTLNPLKHIDPVGTVLVPFGLFVMSKIMGTPPLIIGWAKPVPVGVRNLRNPQRDMAIVAAAGPASNLAMAAGWTLVLALAGMFGADIQSAGMVGGDVQIVDYLATMAKFGILINVLLAVFNMIPIPPLDGGRVASGLLPPRASMKFDQIEPFGFMIILLLIFSGLLWPIIGPVIIVVRDFYLGFVGL